MMQTFANYLAASAVAVAACLFGGDASAQSYPTKPVRIVTGSNVGSILDIAARQVADKLGPSLGVNVIVETKPSAGGIIGMSTVAKSPPDGYTLGIANFVQLGVNPAIYDQLPYDPIKDFAPVILMYRAPLALVVNPSLPVATLQDLIRYAKERPGKLNYSSSGTAQPPHIYMELFKHLAGIDIVHVPYRGAPPAAQALITGEVSVLLETASGVIPQIKEGRMKPMAVTGEDRIKTIPDVPTFAEGGIQGIGSSWVGIIAPAATPGDIIQRLNREIARGLDSPDFRKFYDDAGRIAVGGTSEAFGQVIRDEVKKWPEIAKTANIKPD